MRLKLGIGNYRVLFMVGSTLAHIREDMGYARIGLVAEFTMVRGMMYSIDLILGTIVFSITLIKEDV